VFKIGKNFHVIHMTNDLQALDAFYDEVFSVHRFMQPSYMEEEIRDASLVLVGDFCIEPLAPAFRVEGWDTKPLGRFYNRLGTRWHSIAWYVDEGITELYQGLKDAGVRLYGTGGLRQAGDQPIGPLFTHPLDTVTQLEFFPTPRRTTERVSAEEYVTIRHLADPRFQPGFSPAWWSTQHPLGILKVSRVTLAVRDLNSYRDIYLKLLGGRLLYEGVVQPTRSNSAFIAVGEDLVVELAMPADPSSLVAADLERHHGGIFAVTFKVKDLAAAERYLAAKGIQAQINDGTTLLTNPSTTYGVIMGFTTWEVPNDDRPDWTTLAKG